jgi:hypothetical protein
VASINAGSCDGRTTSPSALPALAILLRRRSQRTRNRIAARPSTTPTTAPAIGPALELCDEESEELVGDGFASVDQMTGVAEPMESDVNPPPRFVTTSVWSPEGRLSWRNCREGGQVKVGESEEMGTHERGRVSLCALGVELACCTVVYLGAMQVE